MACATQSMLSASSCAFLSCGRRALRRSYRVRGNYRSATVFASAAGSEDSDCNAEECAPEKEVGKVSMEWLAEEKTKVVGTFPPGKKRWTGYIEKDTAGQTNIYSIEPAVYVAETAVSSGSAGTSADGSQNTAAIAAGLALLSLAAASSVLIQVSKNTPQVVTAQYSGPPLSYYINKFKPIIVVEAAPPAAQPESSSPQAPTVEPSPEVQVELNERQQGGETQDVLSPS